MASQKPPRRRTASPPSGASPSPSDLAPSGTQPAPPSLTTLVVSPRAWELPESWMATWLDAATRTGSLIHACNAASVSLIDVRDARQRVQAFDEACRLYDEVVDLMICDAVRGDAVSGNARAQSLYFQQVRERIFGEGPPLATDRALTAEQAETLIHAALGDDGHDLDGPAEEADAGPPPPAWAPRRPSRRPGVR